jgi:hypothetical protein
MSRLVGNREPWNERRNGAVALTSAGTGGTTIDGGRSRSDRGRGRSGSQQGIYSIFVGEDAGETLDASIGASAVLELVEGLGPG